MPLLKPLEIARPSVTVLVGLVLLGVILSLARAVLIPIALAILLSFILAPVVLALQRRGVPKIPAVITVTLAAMLLIGGGVYAISMQLHQLASDLPAHKENIKKKIAELRGGGAGALDRFVRMIDEITADVKAGNRQVTIPVTVKEESATGFVLVYETLQPVLSLIGKIGLVIALTIAMLLRREDLRNRLLRLAGHGQLTSTTRALDEATRRISRYLILQLAVNAAFGLVFGLGLAMLGIPYALLWGILAMILRFIPYIGTWLSAALPLLVSFAESDGYYQPISLVAFTVLIGIFTNNVLEPMLISRTTGVSPIGLIVAAAFWTWLWGPIGLILSTSITVCLSVLGRYVPPLRFLDVLFGTEPALEPQLGYYQRLLARDEAEAGQVVETFLKDHSLSELCDEVIVPALVRLKEDQAHGQLDQEDVRYITEATDDLVEDASLSAQPKTEGTETPPLPLVLACPAKDAVDEQALRLLHHLMAHACQVRVLGSRMVAAEMLEQVGKEEPIAVLIGAVHPGGLAKVRYLCKRLRMLAPNLRVLVGYWGLPVDQGRLTEQLQAVGASAVATSLGETRQQLVPLLHLTPSAG